MKFKQYYPSNNEINKKKYKKHSMSPFISLNAGDEEKNVEIFNHVMGTDSGEATSIGENLKESETPTYTYKYIGPVCRFENRYDLEEPIYTEAKSKKHAINMIKGKLKKKYGFAYNVKLDIDEDKVERVISNPDYFDIIPKEPIIHDENNYIGQISGRDVYFEDGYYIVAGLEDIKFVSEEDIRDYLEESYMNDNTYSIFSRINDEESLVEEKQSLNESLLSTSKNLSYKQLVEKLNHVDMKCIDEDMTFHDLTSQFKALVEADLSYEDKEELKKVIQNTNDPETIAAVLQAKASEKNTNLKEDTDSLQARIFDFLDEMGGYADYNQRIEEVSDEFGMSPDEAESYVWDWSINHNAEWEDTADQEYECLQEDNINNLETKYWKVIEYTPGDAETGIYSDRFDTLAVTYANDIEDAVEEFRIILSDEHITIDDVIRATKEEYEEYLDYLSTLDNEDHLEEKLVDAPQEVIDSLLKILQDYGFILDPSFKSNPGKTLMGDVHIQVINPASSIDLSDQDKIQEQVEGYVSRELIDDIHKLDNEFDCPITWSFGPNKDGQVTGGLDIMKQYIEESLEEDLDISQYTQLSSTIKDAGDTYALFRKLEDGKGKWAATKYVDGSPDLENAFEITYDQARGFEPLSHLGKLSKKLGKSLLPKREGINGASYGGADEAGLKQDGFIKLDETLNESSDKIIFYKLINKTTGDILYISDDEAWLNKEKINKERLDSLLGYRNKYSIEIFNGKDIDGFKDWSHLNYTTTQPGVYNFDNIRDARTAYYLAGRAGLDVMQDGSHVLVLGSRVRSLFKDWNENLTEASYGGAYDIEDDMYFTKEELVEFGDDLAEQFSAWADDKCELSDLYMTSPVDLVIEVSESDGVEHQAKVKIDMRRIKLLKDIYKYSDNILNQWKDSYNEYHQFDESLKEEEVDKLRNRLLQLNKAVENGEDPERVAWEKNKIFNKLDELGVNYYTESLQEKVLTDMDLKAAKIILKTSINPKEIAAAQQVIKKYKEQQEKFDYDEAVYYIQSKGISADPTSYVGEYVCDLLDDFAGDNEEYSKQQLDYIIKRAIEIRGGDQDLEESIDDFYEVAFYLNSAGRERRPVEADDIDDFRYEDNLSEEDLIELFVDLDYVSEDENCSLEDCLALLESHDFSDGGPIIYQIIKGNDIIYDNTEYFNELYDEIESLNVELEESISRDDDVPYTYEQMEADLKSGSNNWTADPFEGWVGYEEEFDHAMRILSKHYENVKRLGPSRIRGFGFLATRPSLFEDTVKQNGKWVNKGKEGTHGTFGSKKAADAQRKAMFANGFGESLKEAIDKGTKVRLNKGAWHKDQSKVGVVKGHLGETYWIEWPDGSITQEIKGYLDIVDECLREDEEKLFNMKSDIDAAREVLRKGKNLNLNTAKRLQQLIKDYKEREDLASYIQQIHDEDEHLWNLHGTDYSWLYDELDKYNDDWRASDSRYSIADVIRMMPKEEQQEIFNKLVEPYLRESLKEAYISADKKVLDIIRSDEEYNSNAHVKTHIPDFSAIPDGTIITLKGLNRYHPQVKATITKISDNNWNYVYDYGEGSWDKKLNNYGVMREIRDVDSGAFECLKETLVAAPKDVVDKLLDILNDFGFILDSSIKHDNPYRSESGEWHIQVIAPDSYINPDSENISAQLYKFVPRDMINKIHDLDQEYSTPITWNFGSNIDNKVTGGLDVYKRYIPENFKKSKNINESYSAGYVKGNPYNSDMIYSVSIEGPYENRSGKKYNIVKLNLVCGWDYVDSVKPYYDGQAWVDAEQFVDDVQSEQLVWYPHEESLDNVFEDNGYEKCERPRMIWHYDEENDNWYKDKNFYREALLKLEEDYERNDDAWGEPYSLEEVEDELKKLTINFTDKEGIIRCYYEQEKNYGLQILKQHYRHVDVSDGRTGSGEDMSWVLAYSKLKEEEALNESFWFGKYTDLNKQIHKVYFEFDSSDFEEAEEEFDSIIPEPYIKATLSGRADEAGLQRDGFTKLNESLDIKALTKPVITIKDYMYDLVDNLDEDEIEVFNNLGFIKDNKIIIPKNTRLKYVGNYGRQLLYEIIDTDYILVFNNIDGIFENDFNDYFQITGSLTEARASNLQDAIIDCLDWFILMEMEFPKGKFLADSWEDVKDGIQMGIDPEFEVAEGIVEYFKPIVTFNKRYNKEVEEEGVFQDEIELYQKLIRAMNNYLAKNGYEHRIEEDFSIEDIEELRKQNLELFNTTLQKIEDPKAQKNTFKFLRKKEK